MSKQLIFDQYEREQRERAECKDCKVDWQSKFVNLCARHEREAMEARAEADYYAEIDSHYAQSMN